jgi:uncharacterized protein YndB with AHSA1/START domain
MTDDHVTGDNVGLDAVVIERSFLAPVELLWRLWTEPELFAAWYGPVGAKVVVAKMDVRVGGARLVGMEMDTPGGPVRMWFAGEYREVVAHKRIVYTESMSDADGEALPPSERGMPDGHPVRTEVTVEFIDLDGVGAENPVTSRDVHVLVEEAAEPLSSEHVNGRAGGSRGVVHGRALVQ